MKKLDENQWQRLLQLLDQVRAITPDGRGSALAALRARGEDQEILPLVEEGMHLLEGKPIDHDDELPHLRKHLEPEDVYTFLRELYKREANGLPRQPSANGEEPQAEIERQAVEAKLKLLFKQPPLSPELREWARHQYTEEEILAGLQELRTTGGMELKDFIHELEQIVNAG